MQTSVLRMVDGSEATYAKGSYHMVHDGVVYLNCNKQVGEPHVFIETSIGKKTEEGLLIQTGQSSVVLRAARVISIPVKDASSNIAQETATFMEGGFEMEYGGEKYLHISQNPIKVYNDGMLAFFDGSALYIPQIAGVRGFYRVKFIKQTDSFCKKRKRLAEQSYKQHLKSEKLATVMHNNATRAVELAKNALDALTAFADFETAVRADAGIKTEVFEDQHYCSLQCAIKAVGKCLEKAETKL